MNIRKSCLVAHFLCLTFLSATTIAAPDEQPIRIGDSQEKVLSTMGKPNGSMEDGKTKTFFYSKCTVCFIGGKVSEYTITTDDELKAQKARDEKARILLEKARIERLDGERAMAKEQAKQESKSERLQPQIDREADRAQYKVVYQKYKDAKAALTKAQYDLSHSHYNDHYYFSEKVTERRAELEAAKLDYDDARWDPFRESFSNVRVTTYSGD